MKLYLNTSSDSEFYNLTSLINSGKSCVQVHKATSPNSGETYAIKLFNKGKGETSRHFIQEKDIVANISHPHILKYHEFHDIASYKPPRGYTRECSAIVMEYVPNGDLFNLIAKGAFSEKLARTFFKQIVSAIEYLHNEGIAHLDIKPENFLIDSHGIKLIDFDFSQKIGERGLEGTSGTPGYRCPEIASGELKDLVKADIYSLAVVLFTMVAGFPPYEEVEVAPDVWEFDKFYQAFNKNKELFWQSHNNFKRQAGLDVFSQEFKEFINALMHQDYQSRPSLEELKEMSWFQGETFETEELENFIKRSIE